MFFHPFTLSDLPDVEQIMFSYTNYAPEAMNQTNWLNDREYLHSLLDGEATSEMRYVGRDAERIPQVFLSCVRRKSREGATVLYVTNLFVRNSDHSKEYAAEAARQLCALFSSQYQVCINVLSSAREIIDFWQEQGGKICLELSVFTNADDESVLAVAYPPC